MFEKCLNCVKSHSPELSGSAKTDKFSKLILRMNFLAELNNGKETS